MILLKKMLAGLTLSLGTLWSVSALSVHAADLVVIVNPANHSTFTDADVRNIFLGKTRSFPDKSTAIPVELGGNPAIKTKFNTVILKKDDTQVRAYWARMVFTGRSTPPKTLDSEDSLRDLIAANPNLIGYISSDHVNKNVRVAFKP